MKNRIFHNWTWKLASIVCAVVLWIVIYNINDPADYKRMYNVPVTFVNTEAVTEKGQVYEVLDGTDVVRSVTIKATRSIINDLKESDIKVEADFSKLKLDGTIELKIYSDRHNDAVTFSSSETELKLLVENKVDRSISLKPELLGSPVDGYIVGNSKLAQNRISVSGAESLVNSIDRAAAVVDITDTSEDIFSYADIILYDSEGNEVPKDKLDISMKTVSMTVEILATKTVPIYYTAEGTTAEGYVATGEVTSEATEVLIAGKNSVIAPVREILVEGDQLTYEDATEDVVLTVDLDDYLPEGIIRVDRQNKGYVNVTVQIAPIEESEYVLRAGQVQIENIPEGYHVGHTQKNAEFKVVVRGSKYLLEQLSASSIIGTLDVAAWMEANNMQRLEHEKVYEALPAFEAGEGLEIISAEPIEITASIRED